LRPGPAVHFEVSRSFREEFTMPLASRRAFLSLGVVAVCAGAIATALAADSKRPILTKLTYDPALPQVELFDGLDSGSLTAKVVPNNQFGGKVLITNTSKTPVSVKVPDAVVGVQVFPQLGGMGGGMGGMGGGGMAGGAGFFSLPAERTVSVPMNSVCLEHGKAIPNSRMTYRLARPSEVSDKPELPELLKLIGQNRIDRGAAQAAAWHIASGMSWEKIAAEKWDHVGRPDEPYFSQDQLMTGRMIVADVQAKARDKAKEEKTDESKRTPRVAPKAE
jgi:hypothetical protein